MSDNVIELPLTESTFSEYCTKHCQILLTCLMSSASGSSEEKTRQQFYFLHLSNEGCWMCTIRMRHLITIVRNKLLLLLVSVMFSLIKIKLLMRKCRGTIHFIYSVE